MSYIIEKIIPSVDTIISRLPLSDELKKKVKIDRESIIQIIEGNDNRKILIIGPCSAWPNTAVIEYAKKLKKIELKVADKIKIILRVYTQKPRTNLGWTGALNQPNPYEKPDLEKGIIYTRKMMLEVLNIGLPIADEALFTHNEGYLSDLLSWVAIGARSAEDQEHRVYASMINHPVGLKNPSSGDLKIATNSVISAQNPHTFLLNSRQIKSSGNKHAHLVLRGGNNKSNIELSNLIKSSKIINENIKYFPSIIVDLSHENSINKKTGKKDAKLQPENLINVVNHIKKNSQLNKTIKGFMIESFIESGNQNLNNFKNETELNQNGLSITDSCISIKETEKMILSLYEKL